MSIGPVEYIAIAFPGNKFSGEIIPAIKALQDSGTIKVIDLVLITKDNDGNVAAVELADAAPRRRRPSRPSASRARTCWARRTSRTSGPRSTRTARPR